MPTARRTTELTTDEPDHLRPFTFHGVDLIIKNQHGIGDCPFCGKEGKFCVAVDSGLWRCMVCGTGTDNGGGNALVFIRLLYERSIAANSSLLLRDLAIDRKLLTPKPLIEWGVCQSITTRDCIVPGYSVNGKIKLDQLYQRIRIDGKWCLLPTPGIWPEGKVHALHLSAARFDLANPEIIVCEGLWDGMALDEVLYPKSPSNIIAVPGCNVWRDEWLEMCRGKRVVLLFDSDHPNPTALSQGKTLRAGLDGMCRVAKRLSGIAASVKFIRWGKDGYDPTKPSGWDVRDHLSLSTDRMAALGDLLSKVEVAPTDWFTPHHLNGASPSSNGSADVEPMPCHTWLDCEAAWKAALEWRSELGDAMAVMLAVAASTKQSGDNQLFLQVVGDPGSAKTRM
jgi:ribosomal protein L37AE/L43A